MRASIDKVFKDAKIGQRTVFITYTCCGFKDKEDTVDILLALESGGSNIIELGIPFSDPQADGPTIQRAHQRGVDQNITFRDVLDTLKSARDGGLEIPVILMGYYNNFMQYGTEADVCRDVKTAGGDGFIIVDLPPEEAKTFRNCAIENQLSYIPLLSPTTSVERMQFINSVASGFIYCVSLNGVTGQRKELPATLESFIARVRDHVSYPIAIGFGIADREQFLSAGALADGVVMGSKITKLIEDATPECTAARAEAVKRFCQSITC